MKTFEHTQREYIFIIGYGHHIGMVNMIVMTASCSNPSWYSVPSRSQLSNGMLVASIAVSYPKIQLFSHYHRILMGIIVTIIIIMFIAIGMMYMSIIIGIIVSIIIMLVIVVVISGRRGRFGNISILYLKFAIFDGESESLYFTHKQNHHENRMDLCLLYTERGYTLGQKTKRNLKRKV